MTSDRGEYRAIRRVLLDGPDFQRLNHIARWVFVALKLNLGPSGIDVFYPAALTQQLAAQTGVPWQGIDAALDELEAFGWVKREANVIWIVGQLDNDPHVKASDPKHRKAIVRHVAGLPRLEIVREYVKAHPDFLPKDDDASKPLAWAFQGPPKGHRSTDNKNKPENKKESPPAGADGIRNESWPSRLALVWSDEVGPVKPGRIGAALKEPVHKHGEERVERAMRAYIALQKADGKPCNVKWFADQSQVWVDRTKAPIAIIDGEMSDTLELLTRPRAS